MPVTLVLAGSEALADSKSARDWPVYHGDSGATRYSSLSQINRENVQRLQVAWTYHTGDKLDEPKTTIECTPVVVDGVMYVTSPQLKVIALNSVSGKPIWIYDPYPPNAGGSGRFAVGGVGLALLGILAVVFVRRARRPPARTMIATSFRCALGLASMAIVIPSIGPYLHIVRGLVTTEKFDPWRVNRGVSFWQDGSDRRILFVAGDRLIALRAETGKPVADFGRNGEVDLRQGLGRDISDANYMVTSPGAIYRNLIIIGAKTGEGPRQEAPGHVRAFDVRTGRQAWIFHTIPPPGEFGFDTWSPDYWKTGGGANPWAGMTVDNQRGLVFVATGSPTFDFYGGNRIGQNLFGDSVLALDAASGKRVWHFQAVHHNLWDYDLPCPPVLVTLHRNGRAIDAVVQPTKMGLLFVLNRETGEPLFPVEERPVASSHVPREQAWPTQPFPLKPPPFTRQRLTEADLTDISPEAHNYALQQFRTLRSGNIYLPPDLHQGTLEFPGIHGGANWSGGSFDPTTGRFYLNANELPYIVHLRQSKFLARYPFERYPFDHLGYTKFLDREGYPAIKPPWGTLNAIDLNEGEFVWSRPLGEYPELTAKGVPPTGTENFGGSIVTAGGLVFIGGASDERFRAFDELTGRILWQTKLPAGGYATPATYEAGGRQYVVIAAGGGGQLATNSGDAYVAFALPTQEIRK